jgi:1-deoxy-D-xylulose-5-phosphate synthase
MPKLLDSLDLPSDLRSASVETLNLLAQEIRERIMDVVPKTGGHMGTNLGVVELTLALHKVFDFKVDKLVFDVGHQSYPHKLVTGRNPEFETLRQKDGLCGFPNPCESEYDNFLTGHAGTSVSTALGLAMGYNIRGLDRRTVAIIGDGSMCGLAFEGFNQAGALKKNMMVILNDNKMAISPTVGAFSKYLNKIRSGDLYHHLLKDIKQTLHNVPMVGESLEHMGEKVMVALRDNLLPDRFFSDMGFSYFGPVDGHDLDELIPMIQNLSEIEGPVLLHVLTEKGKGAKGASNDRYKFHSPPSLPGAIKSTGVSWSGCFSEILYREAQEDESIVAITAAMASGTKLEKFIEDFPERSIDTGIAEAHAVTMAGGLQAAGAKPVVLIYSTFLQRAYDSIMHDVCLQKGCSVIFALDRAGLVGDDGPSHHGVYDVAYLRHLPEMMVLAPRDGVELEMMFKWALTQEHSVAFRYARGNIPELGYNDDRPEIDAGVPEVLTQGKKVALMAYGAMVPEALVAKDLLQSEGIDATVVNMRFAKPLKADAYKELLESHEVVVVMEDHALMGGVGSALLEMISDHGLMSGKVIRVGIPDEFVTYMSRSQQFQSLGMDGASVVEKVKAELSQQTAAASL